MAQRTFSGMEVVKVLVNAGGFEWRRTTGDHAQLYYEHPTKGAGSLITVRRSEKG